MIRRRYGVCMMAICATGNDVSCRRAADYALAEALNSFRPSGLMFAHMGRVSLPRSELRKFFVHPALRPYWRRAAGVR